MEEHVPLYKRGWALVGLILTLVVFVGGGLFAWQVFGYYQALKKGENPILMPIKPSLFKYSASKEVERIEASAEKVAFSEDAEAPHLGPQESENVIVVFFDYGCPYCKIASGILRSFSAKHPDVKIVFRDFAIEALHPGSRQAGVMGRCVWKTDPDRFWNFQDAVLANQTNLDMQSLQSAIKQAGADVEEVMNCVESGEAEMAVTRSMTEAYDAGVWATPTFFIRGEKIEGAIPEQLLERMVFAR